MSGNYCTRWHSSRMRTCESSRVQCIASACNVARGVCGGGRGVKSTKVDDCDYQRCSKGFRMGRMSVETRSKVILLWKNGCPVTVIQDRLFQEGVKVSLFALIKKFKSTVLVIDLPRKPRTSVLSECHYRFIYEKMTADNELTSRQLFSLFTTEYPDTETSISTIKRAHLYLGWISKKTRYCALI